MVEQICEAVTEIPRQKYEVYQMLSRSGRTTVEYPTVFYILFPVSIIHTRIQLHLSEFLK